MYIVSPYIRTYITFGRTLSNWTCDGDDLDEIEKNKRNYNFGCRAWTYVFNFFAHGRIPAKYAFRSRLSDNNSGEYKTRQTLRAISCFIFCLHDNVEKIYRKF